MSSTLALLLRNRRFLSLTLRKTGFFFHFFFTLIVSPSSSLLRSLGYGFFSLRFWPPSFQESTTRLYSVLRSSRALLRFHFPLLLSSGKLNAFNARRKPEFCFDFPDFRGYAARRFALQRDGCGVQPERPREVKQVFKREHNPQVRCA